MDSFFLYRDAKECEARFSRTADFVVFNIFVAAITLVLNTTLFSGLHLQPALGVAYAYYWSAREAPATQINFFIVNFSVRYLPYVMIGVQLLSKGPDAALVAISGLLSCHLYIYLTYVYPQYARGTNYLQTPAWLNAVFEQSQPRAPSAHNAQTSSTSSGTSSGRSAGGDSGLWRQRGSGHRLGSG